MPQPGEDQPQQHTSQTITTTTGAITTITVAPINLDQTKPRVRIVTKDGQPRCRATDARSGKQDGVGGLRGGYEYSRSANPTRIVTCTLGRKQTRDGTVLVAKATDKAGNRAVRRIPLR